jgi:hypothetical protein
MRDYTINKKRRDLGDKLLVRFTPDAQRAMKVLMREYPTQSANALVNAAAIALALATAHTDKPVTP